MGIPQESEATSLQRCDENVNITDFVLDSYSGISTEKLSVDFLSCSSDLHDKTSKVDIALQPEHSILNDDESIVSTVLKVDDISIVAVFQADEQ